MGDVKKRKIKSNYESKPDLNLSYLKRMLNLFTGQFEVYDRQVFYPINRNVNEIINLSLNSRSINKNQLTVA